MTHKKNTAWFEELYQNSGEDESAIPMNWGFLGCKGLKELSFSIYEEPLGLSSLKYVALYQR